MAKKEKKAKKKAAKAAEVCACGCEHDYDGCTCEDEDCACHDDACDCGCEDEAHGLSADERQVWEMLDAVPAVDALARLCDDCCHAGWGAGFDWAVTYVLDADEAAAAEPYLRRDPEAWAPLPVAAPGLAGALVLVTADGAPLRNVASDVARMTGLVEVSADGAAARMTWGLAGGAEPTRELAAHLACHAARPDARVVLRMPAPAVTAVSYVLPLDDRAFTRVLWKSQAQACAVIPDGVGVVAGERPASAGFARAVAAKMAGCPTAVLAHRGLMAAAPTFDDALARVSCVEAAAGVYRDARAMNAGSDVFRQTLSDAQLRAAAYAFGASLREDYLN